MAKKRVHLIIRGFVQGVLFRDNARQRALALGLTGWVKNRDDGGVELAAEGGEENLKKLVEWCKRGPPSARVEGVDAEWGECKNEFHSFEVKRASWF